MSEIRRNHVERRSPRMLAKLRFRKVAVLAAGLSVAFATAGVTADANAAAPVWRLQLPSAPTNIPLGANDDNFYPEYIVIVHNIGNAPASSPYTITVNLPAGITEAVTGLSTVV